MVGSSASGAASRPNPTAAPPRAPSFATSGPILGFLNVPVMPIGAGREPMVKCYVSVFNS